MSKIGIIDSGVGGIFSLVELVKTYPNNSYFFCVDNANSPYGKLNKKKLIGIVRKNIKLCLDNGAELIIIACNTASVCALEKMKKEFGEGILCGIYPPLKKELLESNGQTLVLCTQTTYKQISKQYKKSKNIVFAYSANLAKKLDQNLFDKEYINDEAKKLLNSYKPAYVSNIVLACSHFNLFRPYLSQQFPNANIISSEDIFSNGEIQLYTSNDDETSIEINLTKQDFAFKNELVKFFTYLCENNKDKM